MRDWHTWLALAVSSALFLPVAVRAQDDGTTSPTPAMRVSVGDCLNDELGALLQKLSIEASAFPPQVIDWMQRTRPEVSVSCETDVLLIRVVDPNSDRFLEQRIDVDEAVSRAMSRYVALAVVELIEASEEELAPPSQHEPTPPPPTPAMPDPDIVDAWSIVPSEPEPEPDNSSMLRLTIEPILWLGGSPVWLSYGGSLGLEVSLLEWLVPTIDLEASYGRGDVSKGDIDAVLISGAPLALFRFPVDRISLVAGLGFRIGAVVWIGKPGQNELAVGETEALPWHGPCADIRTAFRVSKSVELGLNVEGGWFSYEAHARVFGKREMSLAGGWLRIGVIVKVALL